MRVLLGGRASCAAASASVIHRSWRVDSQGHFHIHTIIRTPDGNDYGKDLLAMHLALDH
ncbi:DUF3500 domain-containing protein [Streptomyces sp. NBC_01166]|uniref:hypothetical protein n=1 Tax=Streptomyces sp. NBC_01166 TaxID=2903755 RepID=UPI0038679190|nr:DUF3500 domain-containing protein [Streptomyces sp. NBC_01166]